MAGSIEYVFPKEEAILNVRLVLENSNVTIIEEKKINNGLGHKMICFLKNKFSIIIYFKSDFSSKIVFENTPEQVKILFLELTTPVENQDVFDYSSIPIYASVKINTIENQQIIRNAIKATFNQIDESKPTTAILYKYKLTKSKYKFTVTQYNNGTFLMQGSDSPIFYDVMSIVESINPITEKENALMYVPQHEREIVSQAIEEISEIFENLYENAKSRITVDVFNFLSDNDKKTLVSAVGILETVEKTDLKIPLYNPILYPFAKVFEGFMIQLMIEKHFFTVEDYKADPNIAKIGNALRNKKFDKYIKDNQRNANISDELKTVWEDLRCHELHSDSVQNAEIINLTDLRQVENRIGHISDTIINGYRILIKYGLTEEDVHINSVDDTKLETGKSFLRGSHKLKDIPKFNSHIGTDESGKGDYFGALVIAGVYVNGEDEVRLKDIGVKDSKKNSDRKNNELARQIKKMLGNDKYNIVLITPEKYNELYSKMLNLNSLLAWGHARVIENILNVIECDNVIADQFGDETYINKALMLKGKKITLVQTPKAERDIAVAAASILARDAFLQQLTVLEKKSGVTLYKGASPSVESAAKDLVEKFGKNELSKYVKLHFKTTERVLK